MFAKKKGGSTADSSQQLEPRVGGAAGRPEAASGMERQPTPPVREPIRRTADYAAAPARRQAEQRSGESAGSGHGEGKKLIVGSGIKLSGEIMACEKLVVEGEVEADLSDSQILEIAETGLFRGRAVVDEAFISGTFEGELTCRTRLHLRASGRVIGTLRYMEMEIERGGKVSGQIEEIDNRNQAAAVVAATSEPQRNADDSATPSAPKAVGAES